MEANENISRSDPLSTPGRSTGEENGIQLELMKDAVKMPTYGDLQSGETTDDRAELVERDSENDPKEPLEKSSVAGASFNTVNSIIGSGILGMPYAMSQAGLPLGIILIFLVGMITDYSMILLIRGGTLSGTNSYQGVVESAFGRPGYIWLTFVQFLYPFIAMISYNVIIGDTITKVMVRMFHVSKNNVLAQRYFIICISTVLVTLPVSLYRNITKLVKISAVSIGLILFIILVIIIRLGTMGSKIPVMSGDWNFGKPNVTQAIAVMAFAFVCQHNSFLIYDSLKTKTEEAWAKVAHFSVFTASLATTLFGACGYATFKSYTQGDILENYCYNDDLVNTARIFYGIIIMFTFPVECFVCREVIENSLKKAGYIEGDQSFKRHLIETLVVVGLTLGLSMTTDCLGLVLELNGLLFGNNVMILMPAISYIKLKEGKIFCRNSGKIPALILTIISILITVVGLLVKFIERDFWCDKSWENDPPYCYSEDTTTDFPNITLSSFTMESTFTESISST